MTDQVHLYRGSPPVRDWSKYQQTVEEWTLCGIYRKAPGKGHGKPAYCVETAERVSCPHCLILMRSSAARPAARKAVAA